MGLVKIVVRVIGIAVLIVVGLGAFLYFTDYEANATVTARASDSECSASASTCSVTVTPKILPSWHYSTQIERKYWQVVCVGYQVQFKVNTHAYKVFDPSHALIYDSTNPSATNTAALIKCGLSNGGVLG